MKIAEDTGMETVGVREMLYLDKTQRSVRLKNTGGAAIYESDEEMSDATNTFKLIAVHSDEEKCKTMLASAITFLEGKQSDVESALGKHEVAVVDESFGAVSDMEVADLQKDVLTDMTVMRKTLSDAKKEMSEKEWSYYAVLMSGMEEEADGTTEESAELSGKISVKYVLLGAVMAAFAYAFILLLVYIFNTKIRVTDNFQKLYGMPQLGMIPKESGKKKILGIVDKWILSIRDHNKRKFSPEEALELAVVAAKMAAGKEELQEICLLGCGLRERPLAVCGKMKARLEEEGVRVNILNNVLYDARMLEELEKTKGAVLAESVGSTLYIEIVEELEFLKRQDIKVLGGILIE